MPFAHAPGWVPAAPRAGPLSAAPEAFDAAVSVDVHGAEQRGPDLVTEDARPQRPATRASRGRSKPPAGRLCSDRRAGRLDRAMWESRGRSPRRGSHRRGPRDDRRATARCRRRRSGGSSPRAGPRGPSRAGPSATVRRLAGAFGFRRSQPQTAAASSHIERAVLPDDQREAPGLWCGGRLRGCGDARRERERERAPDRVHGASLSTKAVSTNVPSRAPLSGPVMSLRAS